MTTRATWLGRTSTVAALVATTAAGASAPVVSAGRLGGTPVALVTAEGQSEVLAVSLPSGRLLRRVHVATDPETIASQPSGPAVVVSPGSHSVTLLAWRTLRTLAVLRGFRVPQLAAISGDGRFAYVSDAGSGELSAIEVGRHVVVGRVFAGVGAHHLAVSPDGRQVWVALGETARTIVEIDTSDPATMRVSRRLHPTEPVHDLAFSPDGSSVWLGSASESSVTVVSASTGRTIGVVPAGPPPHHIAFGFSTRPVALISSGYGASIEVVDPVARTVLRRARLPYGSFNLAVSGGIVVTSSLLDGEVTELTVPALDDWLRARVAPRARDIAVEVW